MSYLVGIDIGAAAVTNTPAELTKFLIEDRTRWQRVARDAKLSAGN